MKRLFSLLLLLFAGATIAFAQENNTSAISGRKPVTSKFELLMGTAEYASHYLNEQVYAGQMRGIEVSFGRLYRKSNSVSWELSLGHWRNMGREILGASGLYNAAGTSMITTQTYDIDYGVYYNWIIKERLQIRLGGFLNVNGGFLRSDSHAVNNALQVTLQTQVYASAQIRYGWNFKKWGLDLYANAATPIFGARSADGVFSDFFNSIRPSTLKSSPYKHFVFSSMHNTLGVDWEMGIDFAMPRISLSLAYGQNGLWWHDYGVQNIRNNRFVKLGISVNLVGMHRGKTANRHF
jgi:hypothetical protein